MIKRFSKGLSTISHLLLLIQFIGPGVLRAQTSSGDLSTSEGPAFNFIEPEKSVFFRWGTSFGRSYSTDGDGGREAFSFEIGAGAIHARNIWTRWQPEMILFSKLIKTDRRMLKIPYGLGLKLGHAYRIAPMLYANIALMAGIGSATYLESIDSRQFRSKSKRTPQVLQASLSCDYSVDESLDFQIAMNINYLQVPLGSFAGHSEELNRSVSENLHTQIMNSYELSLGLRYRHNSN